MDAKQTAAAEKSLRKYLSGISEQLDDPDIQEIMINSPGDVWVERQGQVTKTDISFTPEAVRSAIVLLGKLDGKDVVENSKHAIIDTRMKDLRVAAALKPTALHGHSICIRKHGAEERPLSMYEQQVKDFSDTIQVGGDPEPPWPEANGDGLERWMSWMVRARKNTVVSGGTSTGKTHLLNALIQEIPASERTVTIEDVPELKCRVPNRVQLETNHQVGIGMKDLVKLSLRYRPDRIIVGEIRGAEAYDFLQAMNTGHDGGFCSVHANSAKLALGRLETLVLQADLGWPMAAIRNQIANTIDYVVQMGRTQGQRHLASILKVHRFDGEDYVTEEVFQFEGREVIEEKKRRANAA